MGDLHQVSIDTSNDAPEPTLEELAAKMDEQAPSSQEEAPVADADRPEWLPEKFKSAEDMAKAYSELEKKLGSKPQEQSSTNEEAADEGEEGTPEEKGTDADEEAQKQAQEAADKAGLNLDDLSEKYFEQGALDDSDYEALEKAGYPKHLVDQFIAGQEAIATQIEGQVFSTVGGEDSYKEMLEWARTELTPGEIKAYDKAVNSRDMDDILTAVKGLKARYEASVGFEPTRQIKGEGKGMTAQAYRSVAEMQRDMADPRYKTDPAFRRDVEQKLARSNIF